MVHIVHRKQEFLLFIVLISMVSLFKLLSIIEEIQNVIFWNFTGSKFGDTD